MKDIYLEKIERLYINANGKAPSDNELMRYIDERKDISKEYYKSLEQLGIGRNGIITELDKGCLDSIILFNDINDTVLIEISDYAYSINDNRIKKLQSSLRLNDSKEVVLTNEHYKDYNLSHILDTVIVEGNIDINNSNLYAKMFYDNIDLYLGTFGTNIDIDKLSKIEKLKYIRNKTKLLYDIDLDICEKKNNDSYQVVLHNPLVKSIKSVDKRRII